MRIITCLSRVMSVRNDVITSYEAFNTLYPFGRREIIQQVGRVTLIYAATIDISEEWG
jgi:hypothetical protein